MAVSCKCQMLAANLTIKIDHLISITLNGITLGSKSCLNTENYSQGSIVSMFSTKFWNSLASSGVVVSCSHNTIKHVWPTDSG